MPDPSLEPRLHPVSSFLWPSFDLDSRRFKYHSMSDDDVIPQASYTAQGKERIRLWRNDMTELAKDAGSLRVPLVCTYAVLLSVHSHA